MHYRNGREAKPGDPVVVLPSYPGHPTLTGIVHSLNPGAQSCNGRLAQVTPSDQYVNIGDCLHADDVAVAFPKPIPAAAVAATAQESIRMR